MLPRDFTRRRTSSQSSSSSNKSNTPPSESGYYGDNSQNIDDDFDYPIDAEDQQVIVPINSVARQESNKIQSDANIPIQETESFNPENTQLVVKTESTIIKKACTIAIVLPLVIGALIPVIFTIDGETIDFSSIDDSEKLDKLLDLKIKAKLISSLSNLINYLNMKLCLVVLELESMITLLKCFLI